MAKTTLIVGNKEIEVEQFTKSCITIDHDDEGSIILLLLGQREQEEWTHMCAFNPETAKKLLADLNVRVQNLP